MARIFLSYARDDVAKTKSLAHALERRGHQVWWDPHIDGGTRFAVEIDRALQDAEIVIVLWSRSSIHSTWVQDEASEGRDTGRLVPVSLDDSRPPLGHRQFQSIDLSRWSGRGRVPNLPAIDAAISTVLSGGTLVQVSEQPKGGRMASRRWVRAFAAIAAVLIIVVAALYGTGRFTTETKAASLAVLPFADLSPAHDKAYFAEGVAEEIRTLLSTVPGVSVVGRTSIDMLRSGAGLKEARNELGVTHLLEGSLRVEGDRMRLDVRLLRTADGVQIWAKRFDRDLKDIFRVQSEVGSEVADRLRMRLWRYPLAERSAPTSVQVYDLVLAARAKMSEETYEAALESNRLAQQAARIDPNYSPAWVELSRSLHAIDQSKPEGLWGPQWPAQRELALRYARKAVAVDPESADAQAFLGWAEADNERPELALGRINKAKTLNPGESSVWGIAGIIHAQMCDRRRQLESLRRYVALEPLGPGREDLILALFALGHDAEAEALRRDMPQPSRELLEFWLALDRADFSAALGPRMTGNSGGASLELANMLYVLGEVDRAIEFLPAGYRDSLGAYWRRDYPKAAQQTPFIATAPWNNMRTMAIERALVWTGRHRELVALFDRRFGSVAEFDLRLRCGLPAHAAPFALALRRVGRTAEAAQMIDLSKRRYRQSLEARDNRPEQHVGNVEVLLVDGRPDEALTALERIFERRGSRSNGPAILRLNLADPIFDSIRGQSRFRAVEAKLAAWRARERKELAAAGALIIDHEQ